MGVFLSQDPVEGDINTPPSIHKYLYAFANPLVYIDPDGKETEIIVGLPYRKRSGELSPSGHVAIRIRREGEYDIVHDFGRYDGPEKGILNLREGKEYTSRENLFRDSYGYVFETTKEEEKNMIRVMEESSSEPGTKERKDIIKRYNYRGGRSFELKENYELFGNSCVTTSLSVCGASGNEDLVDVSNNFDVSPKGVQENLEEKFDEEKSFLG